MTWFGEQVGGFSIRRYPGGEDRLDDMAQAWIDGNHEVVMKYVAAHEAEVRSRPVIVRRVGRPRHIDRCRVLELRCQGLKLSDIAKTVACSVSQASVICREANNGKG